jgi:hypothetical protein
LVEADKYSDFRTALRQFTGEICTTLKHKGIATRRWARIVREENSTSFPEEIRPDYYQTSLKLLVKYHDNPPDSLRKLLDTSRKVPKLADTLLVDAGGNPIHDEKTQLWWILNMLTSQFIPEYLKEANTIQFNEQAFNKTLNRLIIDIESPNIRVKELSPLANASLDCESITVAPYLVIRKCTTEELEKWLNDYSKYPYFPVYNPIPTHISDLECAVEVTYERKRYEAPGVISETAGSTADIVTALRLHTDKNVHIVFTAHESETFLKFGATMSYPFSPRIDVKKGEISAANQQELIDTWNRIRSLQSGSPIRLALRRWNTVFERFNPDDALLDYWIALEALFAPDSSQEVRFRSALRIATYLGEPDQREQIYKDLLDSYDLRSRIVHGDAPANKRKTELIDVTRSHLRKALVQILHSPDKFNPRTIEIEQLKK